MFILPQNQEDTTQVHDNPPPVGGNATVQSHHGGHVQHQPKWSHDHKGSHGQYKRTPHISDKSSSRSDANHNRKDRAQQKMRKGMFNTMHSAATSVSIHIALFLAINVCVNISFEMP